jgi:hypothetical protein
MPHPVLTELQKAYIGYCVAQAKFEILSNISISNIDREVKSYDELFEDIQLDEHGFATEDMIRTGKELFPDAPGQPTGSGYGAARALIRDDIDSWLRTRPTVPLNQISWPPST